MRYGKYFSKQSIADRVLLVLIVVAIGLLVMWAAMAL